MRRRADQVRFFALAAEDVEIIWRSLRGDPVDREVAKRLSRAIGAALEPDETEAP